MKTFIIIFILSLAVCGCLGYMLYQKLSAIMKAKKIHEKLKQEKFWEQQQSFDE